MPRLKLDLPDAYTFSTDIPIRIGDINYGGHLGNDAVLAIVQEARVRYLGSHGYSETDVDGAGIIMSDAAIVFKAEAFYGQVLTVDLAITDVTRSGCDLVYRLSDRETGQEVARAKTGIVFFDYNRRKPVAVPAGFKTLLPI
jgi:acyl-CoA thioester hydrolase